MNGELKDLHKSKPFFQSVGQIVRRGRKSHQGGAEDQISKPYSGKYGIPHALRRDLKYPEAYELLTWSKYKIKKNRDEHYEGYGLHALYHMQKGNTGKTDHADKEHRGHHIA